MPNQSLIFYALAPDPEEDPEAQKAMEHLATLALQVRPKTLFNLLCIICGCRFIVL
jgi:hypothetical protein